MARFQDQITDEHLHPIANAQIWVFYASGPSLDQQAALTDDSGAAFVQPLLSDADGIFYYNAADGLYENHIHYAGQLRYVQQAGVGATLSGDDIIAALGYVPAAIDHTHPVFGSAPGFVPASPGDTTLFLRADGVWAPLTYVDPVIRAVQFSSVNGQSLGQAHSGGMNETLVQEYQAKAFPRGKTTAGFTDLVPAIATDLTLSGGVTPRLHGENPMFGMLGVGYQLGNILTDISAEYRIGITNSTGSTNIAAQQKPQPPFTSTIVAANAAKAYAASVGKASFDMGLLWAGGEANMADTKAAYLAALTQLAYDHSTDRKAITGQTDPPALFTYITSSNPINTATRQGVARAQHQAAIDYFNGVIPIGKTAPVPIILATPIHFMGFLFDGTGVHIPADWAYMLGAYAALAQFHCYEVLTDLPLNKRWPPIHPIGVTINGADMTVAYQMRTPYTALQWGIADRPNGDGFAAQPNYGFAAFDGAGLVALNTPQIIGDNIIKFTLAAGAWIEGYRLGYMLDVAADHHLFFIDGAGNLRDNYGDTVRCAAMNLPMHNWVAPFDITVGAGGTWSLS